MGKTWTIPDLMDFEYFLAAEGRSTDASAPQRDRRIFLEVVEPSIGRLSPGSSAFRRGALRLWLEERAALFQKERPGVALPGEVFAESRALLRIIVAVAGLVFGTGVALSLLIYTGKAAVNVTMYLSVLVFLQILCLLVMLRFLFLKASLGTLRHYSVIYGLFSRAWERLSLRIARLGEAGIEGRDEIRAATGLMRGMYGIYGRVLFWPVFALIQLFGVTFNIGAVGATLIRVLTADLAFGWQSTLQMSSRAVHVLVKILAAPWAWLLGPQAYPSLEQIEGSRMVLKEGISSLATGDLVSWWPFLVGAVVCYGLLPRILLSIMAVIGEQRALARVRFTHAGCDQLLMRMRSPAISTAGFPDDSSGISAGRSDDRREAAIRASMDAVVLIPEDIISQCDAAEIGRHLGARLGWKPTQLLAVTGSIDTDRPVIESALEGLAPAERAVVLIQEAWLPPIAEIIGLIRGTRASGGQAMPLAVLLIGKPATETILTPVRPSDKAIWDKALAGLADPYLTLVTTEAA